MMDSEHAYNLDVIQFVAQLIKKSSKQQRVARCRCLSALVVNILKIMLQDHLHRNSITNVTKKEEFLLY